MYLISKKHFVMSLVLLSGVLLGAQSAQANTTFAGSSVLTFTINSITNLNDAHPTDLSGLQILGSFLQPTDEFSFYANTTGDGAISANNPEVASFAVTSSFSKTFAVSGSVLDGSVDSHHTGLYNLAFNNTGLDDYAIDLTLAYQLNASANDLTAESNVAVDYYNQTFSVSDFATVGAYTLAESLSDTQSVIGSFAPYTFTLNAGSNELVFANVVITGNLQAAPVPLPAATWLFLTGLIGVLGFNKHKTKRA